MKNAGKNEVVTYGADVTDEGQIVEPLPHHLRASGYGG